MQSTRRDERLPLRLGGQATLIGGVILLLVLVAVVLPLIFQLNQTALNIEQGVKLAAQVKLRATKEKVLVSIFSNQTAAAILINNTGTVRVIIEKVIIINRTSGEPISDPLICGVTAPCGLIDVANANDNPLVANAVPLFDNCYVGILRGGNPANLECLDNTGKVAVLEPGDVLYISLNPEIAPLLNNTVIYAESAYGVIHPVVAPLSMVAKVGGGGIRIPTSAIPRGLYTPISGFILWGYSDLSNYTYTQLMRPPYRVTTILYDDGVGFETTFIYADYEHPGLYKVLIRPDRYDYIYVYGCTVYGCDWYGIMLYPGIDYYVVGYIGEYATINDKVVLEGWAYDIIASLNGYNISLLQRYRIKPAQLDSPTAFIGKIDMDNNGISEDVFATTLDFYNKTDKNADAFDYGVSLGKPEYSTGEVDDVLAANTTILRDITGVDAIEVALKANYYWVTSSPDLQNMASFTQYYRPMPALAVGLLKFDRSTASWKLVNLYVVPVTRLKPYTFWIDVVFPVNRTDVYRIVIYRYDCYGLETIKSNGEVQSISDAIDGEYAGTDFAISIEHIIVQYYTYNPLLNKIPVVYLVNITGTPYWPNGVSTQYGTFGYLDESSLQSYWSWLLELMRRNGIYPIIIDDWETFKVLLGSPEAPVNAIVIFLHGPVLPYKRELTLYDAYTGDWTTIYDPTNFVDWLADMIKARGWIVVFPYGPPLGFVWDTDQNNWYNTQSYVSGALLARIVTDLLNQTEQVDAKYIFVFTGGFTYTSAGGQYSLDNYTVGIQTLGIEAVVRTELWWAPRIFVGNYSIAAARSKLFYQYAQGLWYNATPPPGYTWSSMGVPENGWAGGVVILPSGRGAAVFVAAPRPGVVAPIRLAALDLAAALYAWMEVTQ